MSCLVREQLQGWSGVDDTTIDYLSELMADVLSGACDSTEWLTLV